MIVLKWPTVFFALLLLLQVIPSASWSNAAVPPRRRRRRRGTAAAEVRPFSAAFSAAEESAVRASANKDGFGDRGDDDDCDEASASMSSRRRLFGSAVVALSLTTGLGGDPGSSAAATSTSTAARGYRIRKVEPDEKDIYRTAQRQQKGGRRPLKVLWVGSGAFALRTSAARSGVYKDLFRAGTEVTALDLLQPAEDDLKAAREYAAGNGWTLTFRRGDATKLGEYFEPGSFDAVVSSLFLCQDFDPAQVCREIRGVLKPGGRYGFYEHVDDIDRVVVGRVFGDRSVIKVESDPDALNVIAGVVVKKV